MAGPRQRAIDIDSHMRDPSLHETHAALQKLVQESHEELENGREEFEANQLEQEEQFMPQPQAMRRDPNAPVKRSSGPLANRVNERRKQEAEEMPLPVPPRLRHRMNDPEIRRVFDPNNKEFDEDTGPISNAPPRGNKTISNGLAPSGSGDANEPPVITDLQRLEKRLADQQAEIEALRAGTGGNKGSATPVDVPKAPGRLAARRKDYDSKYQKVMPPSQCIFYKHFDAEDLQLKRIDVPTQRLITQAKQTNDISLLIDAMGSTVKPGMDIRDVTLEDWFYILYWHKYNSYNKTPLIMRWTSKYGNENRYIIKESDLKYINPSITAEQYKERYLDKGVCVPTLRDWELLNTPNDLNQEDMDTVLRAQYFVGDTIEEKVDNYFEHGDTLEYLELIEEMKAETTHGVVHTVDVVDALFDPYKYVKQRREYCDAIQIEADSYKDSPALYYVYKEHADEVDAEVTTLEETLKNGGQVRAEVETQPVRFNALDIFPFLQSLRYRNTVIQS